jgi:hypothetical protein
MSISWGKKERFEFKTGGSLLSWRPPAMAGIYAITYKGDPEKPKAHHILFFGQTDNLSETSPEWNEEVVGAWKSSSQDIGELCVFVHPMPRSSTGERLRIQEQLVAEYRPRCNR